MSEIIIGTRGSKLARTQAGLLADSLAKQLPDYNIILKEITTKGDRILDKPLSKIGGKGLFIKEIELALLAGEIDLAVHSLKDLPTKLAEEFKIAAIPKRANPLDILISKENKKLAELPQGAKIGTGSLRRKSQLLNYRPDLKVIAIRGNIDTRLKKLFKQDLDGIILAASGLIRMGWEDKITQYLSPEISIPAVGQGALAVEIRSDDEKMEELLRKINHQTSQRLVKAERSFLKKLEGSCKVPIGAYAELKGEQLSIEGMVAKTDGTKLIREELSGELSDADLLGLELAEKLLEQGAEQILAEIKEG